MTCACRCHAYGPGANVTCDIGPEQPGGNQSCTADLAHSVVVVAPLDEACVLGHAEPTEREFGYACRRHYHWIDRTLQQIEELYALLPYVEVIISGPMKSDGRGGSQFGSPAPGRIEVMALRDKRAKTPIDLRADPDREGVYDVPDMPGTLASWTRMVVEERETTDHLSGDVCQSVRVLRRERLWIAQQEWLDDYAHELGDVHRALAQAAGDTMWPRPIGKCPNDQSPLFNTVGVDEVTCRRCKTTWRGVHLARLRLIHEQEAKRDGASSDRHEPAPAEADRRLTARHSGGDGSAHPSAS